MNHTVEAVLLNEYFCVKASISAGEISISELFSQVVAAERDLWRWRQRLIDLEVFLTAKHNRINSDIKLPQFEKNVLEVSFEAVTIPRLPTCKPLDEFFPANLAPRSE